MMRKLGLMIALGVFLISGICGICFGMAEPVAEPTKLQKPIALLNKGNNFYPVFSPDSEKIVFQSDRSGNMDIWMMHVDGSELRQLTSEESEEIHPGWSTDGSKIVFSSSRGESYDIWCMDVNGQNREKLTKDDKGDEFWPRYSPVPFAIFKCYTGVGMDTKFELASKPSYKIVYSSKKTKGKSIWLMKEDGSKQENITKGFNDYNHPEWSPLGRTILFDSAANHGGKIGKISLYREWYQHYEISREVSYITSTFEGNVSYPNYSPNNVNISFVSDSEIFIADKKQVNRAEEIDGIFKFTGGTYFRWSPDGKRVVYTLIDEEGKSNIHVADSPVLLSNAMNLYKFTELEDYYKEKFGFKEELTDKLVKNNFVAIPGKFWQFYHIYENANYSELPVFITTDSILHTYHIFFDYTLRKLETDRFYGMLKDLSRKTFAQSLKQYRKASSERLKKACLNNLAFFAVGNKLLKNNIEVPKAIKAKVDNELKKIKNHEGQNRSSIFDQIIDYSQFIPRGHYTRTEKLKRYFKAMMWYGQVMYRPPYPEKDVSDEEILQSLLIYSTVQKAELFALWNNLYDPVLFFVGGADDLSLNDYHKWVKEAYGDKIDLADLSKEDKLNVFIQIIKKAKKPRIGSVPQEGINPEFGVSFRFMPQRFTPDAKILQELVYPSITKPPKTRGFPVGLDVMAALGSERAYQILDEVLGETKNYTPPEDYPDALKALTEEFCAIEADVWKQNLYWGWLYTLRPLLTVKKEGYPVFMQNTAWQDKELFTALGSWTELKHDTILYAKQPYGAEGGGGMQEIELPIIPKPRGYVEPNLELYGRLAWLTRTSSEGLKGRNLIDDELKGKYNKLQELIAFMQRIAEKELKNEPVTEDEYSEIRDYGKKLERITISVMEGEEYSTRTDEKVALVADIYTNVMRGLVLEEAVGDVFPIYVIVQQQNKDYLTIGGIFSYYEFTQPMSDRLTDEKWQKMIEEGKQPVLPVWTESFIAK